MSGELQTRCLNNTDRYDIGMTHAVLACGYYADVSFFSEMTSASLGGRCLSQDAPVLSGDKV